MPDTLYLVYEFVDCLDSIWLTEHQAIAKLNELQKVNGSEYGSIDKFSGNAVLGYTYTTK